MIIDRLRKYAVQKIVSVLFALTRPISYHKTSLILSCMLLKLCQLLFRQVQHFFRGMVFRPTERILDDVQSARFEKLKMEIDTFGVSIVSNYFSDDRFAELVSDFDAVLAPCPPRPFRGGGTVRTTTVYEDDPDSSARHLYNALARDPVLLSLVEHIHRRKISTLPRISLQELVMAADKPNIPEPNAVLHSDRHYHHAKAFFYLNDLNGSSGAYLYAKGSNKIGNIWRLIHEVDIDVRESLAVWRRRLGLIPGHLSITGIEQIRPSLLRHLQHPIQSMDGDRNSFVFSDNIGFHARGNMVAGTIRRQVHIHFTYIEVSIFGELIRRTVLALKPALRRVVI
jgi:hypothetical protein